MTDKLLKAFKILIVVLFVIAIGMGVWLLITRFLKIGGGDGEEENGEAIELVWWIVWENEEDMKLLADLYKQNHPNVTIKIQSQLEDQYKSKAIERLGDATASERPDMLRIHNTWLPQFRRYLVSLPSSVMSESEYAQIFYETAVIDFTGEDGGIYAIPLMFDGLGVYYNKDLLQQAGYSTPKETWDELLTQAKALTQYDSEGNIEVGGIGLGTENNVEFSFEIVSLLMLQEGATIVDPTTGTTTFSEDSEMKAAKAIKFYTDFASRHEVWDRSLSTDVKMFTEGRLAMMFAPSWRVLGINSVLENEGVTLNYDIAPVPQQPTETGETVNWADYWAEAVSAQCEHPDIAWDFLKFISEEEQLKALYEKMVDSRGFGEVYPRKEMADEIISDRYVAAYVRMAETARTWRMVDKEDVSEEFNGLINEISVSGTSSRTAIQSKLVDLGEIIDQIILSAS